MSDMLHAKTLGTGRPVILLHGLFGQGSNLQAQAKALAEHYCATLLDLPNHGRSLRLDTTSLTCMAEVLGHWLDAQGYDQIAIMGHSLGGKVAMEYALGNPARVAALVIADIAPVAYRERRHDSIFRGIEAVAEAGCESRRDAGALLADYVEEPGVADFLLMSLTRDMAGRYTHWRFNWPVLASQYAELLAAPTLSGPYVQPALFIKGGQSDYLLAEHAPTVKALFPEAQTKIMADCGHWLHAQQPRLFNSIMLRFLKNHYV